MSEAESMDLPDDIMADLSILSGGIFNNNDKLTEEKSDSNIINGLQSRFITERSKTKVDYTIEGMEVKTFNLADDSDAIKYAEFVSKHLANMMSNAAEYRFTETPVQFVPSKNEVKALVIAKAWRQVKKPSLVAPNIDIIPKTN